LFFLLKDFDARTSDIIEGISKIVAAICILQLSLKLPKWLGVYESKKQKNNNGMGGIMLRSIKFNVGTFVESQLLLVDASTSSVM